MINTDPALKFLTLAEAASLLQISKRTLFRLIYGKRIPALKIGGQWRISEGRLREWINDAEIAPLSRQG